MIYKRYTVEVNGQVLSVELAKINNSLSHALRDNGILFTEEVLEQEREYDYYKDDEKMEKFLESLIYLLYPELKANISKLSRIVKNLSKEFSKIENIYIGERLSLDEGYSILISFDNRDSFIPLYSYKYDAPLLDSVVGETNKFAAQIYSRLW
jgi:hypothetical protein